MYADLTGNCKKQKIKSFYDNKCDVEFGTGLFAINCDGRQTPWVYQDAKGEWHYTSGQQPQPYLEPALVNNTDSILQIFRDTLEQEIANNARL